MYNTVVRIVRLEAWLFGRDLSTQGRMVDVSSQWQSTVLDIIIMTFPFYAIKEAVQFFMSKVVSSIYNFQMSHVIMWYVRRSISITRTLEFLGAAKALTFWKSLHLDNQKERLSVTWGHHEILDKSEEDRKVILVGLTIFFESSINI